MINIIKHKPEKYIINCKNCDCKFEYALSDLKRNYYCQKCVECPECGEEMFHKDREKIMSSDDLNDDK